MPKAKSKKRAGKIRRQKQVGTLATPALVPSESGLAQQPHKSQNPDISLDVRYSSLPGELKRIAFLGATCLVILVVAYLFLR